MAPGAASAASTIDDADISAEYSTVMTGFAAELTDDEVAELEARADVVDVRVDTPVSLSSTQSDPVWGLDRIDQRSTTTDGKYSYETTGAGVTAYIIDTGVNFRHTEFAGRTVKSMDFVKDGQTSLDCNGHGTHVAGTIGGKSYGVAKKVNLVSLRTMTCAGGGYSSTVVTALEWVAKNAKGPSVVNMSVGGRVSSYVDQAVRNLTAAGITVVAAAGNGNTDACNFSPSRESSAITVGATDSTDTRSTFSNYGSCVDVFAPGSRIISASSRSNTGTVMMSGTSMAAPHVTGLVARYLQTNPSASAAAVSSALRASATSKVVKDARSSNSGLVYGSPAPAVLPGAPGSASATRNDAAQSATLKWKAPASSGSAKITGYRVSRDGTDAKGVGPSSATVSVATASKAFANLVPGKAYKLSVQAITSAGIGKASTVSVTIPKPKTLTASSVPKVSGTAKVGQTLTTNVGKWAPTPVTLSYQWKRNGTAIKGATSAKYKLVSADVDKSITVTVSGKKSGYLSASKTSAALKVPKPSLTSAATPKIAGKSVVGQTLTATAGTWSSGPVALTYQWKRGGTAIKGATSAKYKITTADAGTAITVSVTGRKTGYASATKTSAAIKVAKLKLTAAAPQITGNGTVGQTLTALTGTWSPGPVALSYQWKRNGVVIPKATSKTYKLVSGDAGKKITVTVTGKKTGYDSQAKVSAAKSVTALG